MSPAITPLGDSAITITFGDKIDEQTNQQVLSLFHTLQQQNIHGVKDIIPAYASVTVVYDIMQVKKVAHGSAYTYMNNQLQNVLLQPGTQLATTNRQLTIPVCYDPSLGIDLQEMSDEKDLSIEEIIQLHTSISYRVYMIGFLPGFAYMGTVDDKIATPRKATPRQNIPAGSVGIAGSQTGIYPFNSPGGWNIIGQTPLPLFSAHNEEPCLFQPGDVVRFEQITLAEFHHLEQQQ